MVAQDAVERGDERVASRSLRKLAHERRELPEDGVHARAGRARDAADRAVDLAGGALDGVACRARQADRRARDAAVEGLDEVGEAERRVDGEAADAAQVVDRVARASRAGQCSGPDGAGVAAGGAAEA